MRKKKSPVRQSQRLGESSRRNIQPVPDNNEELTDTDDDNIDENRRSPPRKPAKKKKKFSHALAEIRLHRKTYNVLIPKLPFGRIIREILQAVCPSDFRISKVALEALQESSEAYLVLLFEDAYRCTLHRKRITLQPIDIQLARCLRGVLDNL